ncbi:ABC transporter permease subunit [Anaerocolumna sp. AGMB13020]|uniref:ABC transporter permease n=1 Tax=Anaerocolumna sp. AGMB13020 TaxID=3081750 RepID=UPI002954F5BF|nr:ABC transporter permease subunit [Anaerocolumna sp. AGMB13020]WOO35205.1 ABC transporter permease subunit [Anaerocolumna sp. AGMB13020]
MKDFLHNTWKHKAHLVMCLPAILVLFLFSYMPMVGLVMAFKKFDYSLGIWGSPWVNLDNFQFLLASGNTFTRMTRNTLMYYAVFTVIGTTLNIVLAIGIDQFVFKRMGKAFQSIMIIPVFISFAAVQFIVYAFFSNNGMVNNIIDFMGNDTVRWYTSAKYWPFILTTVKIWSSVGYGSVLYMSVLAGIDQEMYEAAQIDGANKWKQIWNITLPSLVPMITIMLLLGVGGVMRSDTGLFYQVTRNSGILYETTQVIDSYILNAILTTPDFGFTAATTFYQSIIGLVMILVANGIVRKAAPENALF